MTTTLDAPPMPMSRKAARRIIKASGHGDQTTTMTAMDHEAMTPEERAAAEREITTLTRVAAQMESVNNTMEAERLYQQIDAMRRRLTKRRCQIVGMTMQNGKRVLASVGQGDTWEEALAAVNLRTLTEAAGGDDDNE